MFLMDIFQELLGSFLSYCYCSFYLWHSSCSSFRISLKKCSSKFLNWFLLVLFLEESKILLGNSEDDSEKSLINPRKHQIKNSLGITQETPRGFLEQICGEIAKNFLEKTNWDSFRNSFLDDPSIFSQISSGFLPWFSRFFHNYIREFL